MILAGVSVGEMALLELFSKLRAAGFESTAAHLETSYEQQRGSLGLTVEEREQILVSLADCSETLAELRTVLLQEYQWRQREGL
jgi:hypothetical protein